MSVDLYYRTVGEIEAREVQARMNMTYQERLSTPPTEKNSIKIYIENFIDSEGGQYKVKDSIPSIENVKLETEEGKKIQKSLEKAQIKFSLRTDSEGNKLTEQQQDFFKDSKAVDKDGRLMVLYHGTSKDFNVFDIKKVGENYSGWSQLGKGFYFTESLIDAEGFAKRHLGSRIISAYLNLKNPFDTRKFNKSVFKKCYISI